jgi:uncharacterized RDD family membrane protein YckC
VVQGAPAVAERPLELEVTGGPSAGSRLALREDLRLGSAETGTAALGGDRWLSAAHANLRRAPEGWQIEDLRSLEGTKLNGRAVKGSAALHVGDVIEVGASRIVVLPDAGASVAQVTAASPEGVAASLRAESRRMLDGKRLLAFVIDALVLAPVAFLIHGLGHGRWVFVIASLAIALTYFFLCESLTGQTLGKRIVGLKVVRLDGRPLAPSNVAARTVLRLVDQQLANLVGMLTMVISGGRRQRLGDLAARTAVTRASTPGPRPLQRGRERFALYAYPVVWLAPAVLLFALVPDVRVLPCKEAGIAAASGTEGSCLISDRAGNQAIYHVVNSGHALEMPGYSIKLVKTSTRPAPAALRNTDYYGHGSGMVVGFKLQVKNTGKRPLRFDADWRELELGVSREDGYGTVAVRELPPKAKPGFRTLGEGGPIAPGATRVAWASFGLPAEVLPQLTQPVAGLGVIHSDGGSAYVHMGEIRFWRSSTPAGARALSGLHE